MKRIYVAAGATYGFMAAGSALRKVTLATGASTTLKTDVRYTALCYGSTTLFGATANGVYTINQTTGVATLLFKVSGDVTSIVYKDADELYLVVGNVLMLVDTDDGATTYLNYNI